MRRIFLLMVLVIPLCLPVRAAREAGYLALTFDGGPSGRYTRQLLEGLRVRSVPATFLLQGYPTREHPDLAREILAAGHEMGLQGFSQKPMTAMTRRQIAEEMREAEAQLPEGCRVRFFRPAGGMGSAGVRQVAQVRNYAILGWSVDTRDTVARSPEEIASWLSETVRDGDILRMNWDTEQDIRTVLEAVDALQKKGFTFVSASRLARLRGLRPRPGEVYCRFSP